MHEYVYMCIRIYEAFFVAMYSDTKEKKQSVIEKYRPYHIFGHALLLLLLLVTIEMNESIRCHCSIISKCLFFLFPSGAHEAFGRLLTDLLAFSHAIQSNEPCYQRMEKTKTNVNE